MLQQCEFFRTSPELEGIRERLKSWDRETVQGWNCGSLQLRNDEIMKVRSYGYGTVELLHKRTWAGIMDLGICGSVASMGLSNYRLVRL